MPLSEILNTGVYALFIGLAAIGVLLGYVRGLSRQTMKVVTVAAAFVISLMLYTKAYPWLYSYLDEKSLFDVMNLFGFQLGDNVKALLETIPGEDIIYVVAVPMSIIIFPWAFVSLFITISCILVLPYIIICGVLGFSCLANSPATRILGAVLGGIQGAFIAAIVLVPFTGLLGVATEAVTYAETDHPGFKNTIQVSDLYHENLDLVVDNPIIKAVDEHCGFIYDEFTTITVEEETIDVITVIDDSLELYVYYGELGVGDGFDFKKLTPENKVIIDQMINSFGDDKFMTVLLSDLVSAFGKATQTGVYSTSFEEPIQTIAMSLFGIIATCDENNIEADLHTIADVYYLLSDENVMNAPEPEEIFTSFMTTDENGNTAFDRLAKILNANPRFANLDDMLTTIAMDMLLQNSGVDKEVVETVEEVKTTINNVLNIDQSNYETVEEYKEAVNTEVAETLENNGIALSPEQVDQLSDYIIKEKEENGKTEFTDADMAKFMAEYYNIYANGGSIPGLGDIIPGGDINIGGGSIGGNEGSEGGENSGENSGESEDDGDNGATDESEQ